jgi:hypothetical protein
MRNPLKFVAGFAVATVFAFGLAWAVGPSRGVGRYQLGNMSAEGGMAMLDTKTGELFRLQNVGGNVGFAWLRWAGVPPPSGEGDPFAKWREEQRRKPLDLQDPAGGTVPKKRWDADGNPIK